MRLFLCVAPPLLPRKSGMIEEILCQAKQQIRSLPTSRKFIVCCYFCALRNTCLRKSEMMRLFLCEARQQIRSIVDLCEEFGVRRSRAKRTHQNDFKKKRCVLTNTPLNKVVTDYQLAFLTPGIRPAEAISRNWIRLMPN